MTPKVLTIDEAAESARVSTSTLRRAVKAGHLRVARLGRCVRILDEDLVAYLRSSTTTPGSSETSPLVTGAVATPRITT